MPDEHPPAIRWTELLPALRTLADAVMDWPSEVVVLGRRFGETTVRSRRPLPISSVENDDDSGEIVGGVPGLLRANPIGREALRLHSLLDAFEALTPDRQFFQLVFSDDLCLDEVPAFVEQFQSARPLPDLAEVELEDLRVRFDLPPRVLGVRLCSRRGTVRFDVKP